MVNYVVGDALSRWGRNTNGNAATARSLRSSVFSSQAQENDDSKFLTAKCGRGDSATVFSLAQGRMAEVRELAAPVSKGLVPKTKQADSALGWTLPAQAANLPELASRAAALSVADRSAAGCAYSAAVEPESSRETVWERAAKPSGGSSHLPRLPCPYAPPSRRSKP